MTARFNFQCATFNL